VPKPIFLCYGKVQEVKISAIWRWHKDHKTKIVNWIMGLLQKRLSDTIVTGIMICKTVCITVNCSLQIIAVHPWPFLLIIALKVRVAWPLVS